MKHKILNFIWKIFGYPDLPPRDFRAKPRINKYTGKELKRTRYDEMIKLYLDGSSISRIAKEFNVTRERVRQYAWKAYRENTK